MVGPLNSQPSVNIITLLAGCNIASSVFEGTKNIVYQAACGHYGKGAQHTSETKRIMRGLGLEEELRSNDVTDSYETVVPLETWSRSYME